MRSRSFRPRCQPPPPEPCLGAPPRRYLFATTAERFRQPSRYSPVIDAVNARLEAYAAAQQRVTYVDCNAVLLAGGGGGSGEVRPPAVAFPGEQPDAGCLVDHQGHTAVLHPQGSTQGWPDVPQGG